MSDGNQSIQDMIADRARRSPEAMAIASPGRPSLSYGRLHSHIGHVAQRLNDLGLGRNDRVAVVLPGGPEMAVAFLAVASAATCAPLNPAYRETEFGFYLPDLNARALIVQEGMDTPAIPAARARGIQVVTLSPVYGAEGGIFRLSGEAGARTTAGGFSGPSDVALVLHTSGTTSRPKIVPLTQSNLCISANSIRATLHLQEQDRCLNVMPLFHIHGLVGALLSSVCAGAGVVCTPGFDGSRFFEWMEAFRPTWYTAVPTIHQSVLTAADGQGEIISRSPLRFIRSSSAPLPKRVLAGLESVFRAPVIESYGMTEASHQMASNPLPPAVRKPGSVGVAAGPAVAVMGEEGSLLAGGRTGEVVVRGEGVTAGYEHNPEANAGAFLNGWFRTGDQGYIDGDGYLYLTGRIKEIINRGGLKISPQEVDDAFMEHPSVAQAVTFAVPHPTLGEDVASAVVLAKHRTASERELRAFAFSRLADYKVPTRVVVLEEIPKGPSGKLLRKGMGERLKDVLGADYVAPRDRVESTVAGIWADVLAVGKIGVHDNFFMLGGDSLKATQVMARIQDRFGIAYPLQVIFQAPTLGELASILEAGNAGAEKPPPIPARADRDPVPLSFAQQRLWFLDRMEPGTSSYNVTRGLSLVGPLDVRALERGLCEILRRHDVLRTIFPMAGDTPAQAITPYQDYFLPVIDMGNVPEDVRKERALRVAEEEFRRSFDLSNGPLFRAALLRLGNTEHVLLVTMHHIVSDGWSMGVFFRELSALYEAYTGGSPSPLSSLPAQYADFSGWQRQWFQGEVLDRQLSYWKRKLAGELTVLDLPADRSRPTVQTYHGDACSEMLPRELAESLKTLSRKEGVTLFMTLLAAFQVLLHRYTGKDDIPVGTPIANRSRVEIEGLIGFFVNTLVLRTDLSGGPGFRELLARVRETALGAYDHQDLPFEKLVEDMHPARDLSRPPLFQVMFQLRNVPNKPLRFPGLEVRDFDVPLRTAKFDLSVDITEEEDGLLCLFEFNTDLFEEGTIRRMMGHFRTLLEAVANDPDRKISVLPLLTDAERARLLVEWNDTRADFPRDRCVHQLFEDQVERTPDAPAVRFEGSVLTYRELNARANRLARFLVSRGVEPDTPVGICMERSIEMVVAILGVLKAGGAYVPLDPSYPEERLAFMLEDTGAPVLLTLEDTWGVLPEQRPETVALDASPDPLAREREDNLHGLSAAENLAYVIYTSGSTGMPKGVAIPHRTLCNNIFWAQRAYGITDADAFLQLSSFCFDASVSEIFLPLLSGGSLVMAPPKIQHDPEGLIKLVAERRITTIQLVPSFLKVLLEEQAIGYCGCLKRIICGGEVLPADLRDRCLEMVPAQLFNSYGPTETTIDATCWACRPGEALRNVPIGRPIANFQTYILDRNLQPVPVGVPGELYIGGAGLARGYLNRPELTAEKFIPDPFRGEPGERVYRTGDLVRYLPDGNIEFLDRVDQQVKVRGYRIELGEIEAALRRHPAVADAVVLAKGGEADRRLVAYLVLNKHSAAPSDGELRDRLKIQLPDYMVPASLVTLKEFPLTPSGKVDRRALPDPGMDRSGPGTGFVAPRDALENHLKEIWQWVLGVKPIGIRENFFDLGGHSLLAVQLFAYIGKFFGKSLPLSTLFHAPTIEGLAKAIREEGWAFQWSYLVPVRPTGSRPPFFCVHPHDGDAFRFYDLAVLLGPDQPFYGLRARTLGGGRAYHRRIEDMARDYIDEIRMVQPEGPYFLGGHCFGGIVAIEMARQLRARGAEVALVALIFSHAPGHPKPKPNGNFLRGQYYDAVTKVDHFLTMFPLVPPSERWAYLLDVIRYNGEQIGKRFRKMFYRFRSPYGDSYLREQEDHVLDLGKQITSYSPAVYPGRLTLFRAQKEPMRYRRTEDWGWGEFASGGLDIYEVPGYPQNQDFKPRLKILAEKMKTCLDSLHRHDA
jgi:amino acid adenylation domain-containing protein